MDEDKVVAPKSRNIHNVVMLNGRKTISSYIPPDLTSQEKISMGFQVDSLLLIVVCSLLFLIFWTISLVILYLKHTSDARHVAREECVDLQSLTFFV